MAIVMAAVVCYCLVKKRREREIYNAPVNKSH